MTTQTLTKTDWLNLLTAREEHVNAEAKAESANADRTAAKNTLDDARETLDTLEAELIETYGEDGPKGEDGKRLMREVKAVQQAHATFEARDRQKRQADDLRNKMLERVLTVIDEVANLDTTLPLAGQQDRNGPRAWERVELKNVLGDMWAEPFGKIGIRTVQEAKAACERGVGALVKDEGVTQPQADYLLIKLADWLVRRGVEHKLPAVDSAVREQLLAAPPAGSKPAKEGKKLAQTLPGDVDVTVWSDDEPPLPLEVVLKNAVRRREFTADPADAQLKQSWLALHRGGVGPKLASDEAAIALQNLANECEIATPALLVLRLEQEFEARSADGIAVFTDLLDSTEKAFMSEWLHRIMHQTGSPRLYQMCDHCIARCEDAFDDFAAGTSLGVIARRPDAQRYAAGAEPEPTSKPAKGDKKSASKSTKNKPAKA